MSYYRGAIDSSELVKVLDAFEGRATEIDQAAAASVTVNPQLAAAWSEAADTWRAAAGLLRHAMRCTLQPEDDER